MRKKSFTIVEILTVVVIMWLILGMVKNFLNTGRQEKLIFGETCMNYVFGEIQRFQDDIKMNKTRWMDINGTPASLFRIWMNTIPKASLFTTGIVDVSPQSINFEALLVNSSNQIIDDSVIKTINFHTNNIPQVCNSPRFMMVSMAGTYETLNIFFRNGEVTFSDDLNFNNIAQYKVDTYFEACEKVGQSNDKVKNCVDIGKLDIDRRSNLIFYLKCVKVDAVSWNCKQRPTIN
jgi:hypothetical protein